MLHGYCIRSSADALPPAGLLGVDRAPVRVLASRSLALWVSDASDASVMPERLRDHERVVRTALASATPLPLRFGTRFVSEREAIDALRSRTDSFAAALQRVAGHVEMGLRVSRGSTPRSDAGSQGPTDAEGSEGDPTPAPDAIDPTKEHLDARIAIHAPDRPISAREPPSEEGGERAATGELPTPGREYLRQRKSQLEAGARERREADRVLHEIAEFVALPGFQSTQTVIAREDLFGTVAHLVHRADLRQYQQRLAELRSLRPDLRLVVSGPWAPYSFV